MSRLLRECTTEQLRIRAVLEIWVRLFMSPADLFERREARREIREIVAVFPWAGDLLPDAVWNALYRVRAQGTIAP